MTDNGEDLNRRVIPKLPGPRQPSDQATEVPAPRRSPEAPTPKVPRPRGAAYDEQVLGFGAPAYLAAFGSAA